MIRRYDVIVVGAGHAGCEAALAAASMGADTLLCTLNLETIGALSCNPAIGGLAKSTLVREIDALGGHMAILADRAGLQWRMLNTGKGPAVQALRVQVDRQMYPAYMRTLVEGKKGLTVYQSAVTGLTKKNSTVNGVILQTGRKIRAGAVILTTGTFLKGLIHIGLSHFPGGRINEPADNSLSDELRKMGFSLGRLKTGTSARVHADSLDYSVMRRQGSDPVIEPFSLRTTSLGHDRMDCYVTQTTAETDGIVRHGLKKSPLYTGIITGKGPRYCPSFEDKVVQFPDRKHHHVFIEPEGKNVPEVYVNGLSSSLPEDVQERMIRSARGMEKAVVLRPGYGIEYDFVNPTQLEPSLRTKAYRGLYLAGQINGTSGYEEAAAQGLMAAINAVRTLDRQDPVILDRSMAYIGVLIDDLVTRGTEEPYRMFTSQAEYRLVLRQDNADLRLCETGHECGLVSDRRYRHVQELKKKIAAEKKYLLNTWIRPTAETRKILEKCDGGGMKKPETAFNVLKRPGVEIGDILRMTGEANRKIPTRAGRQVTIDAKYSDYIRRQEKQIQIFRQAENHVIPARLDYTRVKGISEESREKLINIRPRSLGQAGRIPGVSPADIMMLRTHVKRMSGKK